MTKSVIEEAHNLLWKYANKYEATHTQIAQLLECSSGTIANLMQYPDRHNNHTFKNAPKFVEILREKLNG